jgi:hypothetical protein
MDYKDVRELVRIRHELRTLSSRGDRAMAVGLLERMRTLAAGDSTEQAAVQPEMARWRFVFGIDR